MNQRKIGVLLSYLKMGLSIFVALIFTPFMLEKFGNSGYGIYALSASLISFIALLDLGLSQTLVRYLAKARALNDKEEEARLNGFFLKMYLCISITGVIFGLFLINLYPLVAKQSMTSEELKLFKIVFSLLLVDTALSFPMSIFASNLTANEKYIFLRAVDVILFVPKYLILFVLLTMGFKVVTFTFVTVLLSILMRLIYGFYCFRVLHISFQFKGLDKQLIHEILLFSFFILINMVVDFLYGSTDKLILGAVAGTTSVSIYTLGIYFQSYFQQLSTSISGVFLPEIVRLYENGRNISAISDLFVRVGSIQMSLLFFVLGGYVVVGPEFINLWVGDGYSQSYFIGLLIMIPSIIPLTQNVGLSVLRAMNLHKYRSYMYLAIAILNILISIPLAIKYGGIGAAVGTCIATIIGQICYMNYFYSKRIGIKILEYWKVFLKYILTLSPIVCICLLSKHFFTLNSWLKLLTYIFVYTVVYAFLHWHILASEYEKGIVTSALKKIFRSSTSS